MPLITVSYTTSRQSPSLKADIASAGSELTAEILHKDPKVTAIIVKSRFSGYYTVARLHAAPACMTTAIH